MVDLHLVDLGVAFHVGCWADYFFCALSQFVRQVLCGGHVPLLELGLLHAVADEEVVGHASLVELDVVFEILVLLLIQQILLSSLRHVVV